MFVIESGSGEAGGVTVRFRREEVEVSSESVVEFDDCAGEYEGREIPMNRFVLCRKGKFSSKGESGRTGC